MKVCITTVCDSNYHDYVNLFIKSCKLAYPEYDVKVMYRGVNSGEFDKEYVTDNVLLDYPYNKATSSTIRFCLDSPGDYDYVYITDVDMILMRDPVMLHEKHLKVMEKTGLCYENFAVPSQEYGFRMPGVHFASKEWFERTKDERSKYLELLGDGTEGTDYRYDEAVLHNICVDSGLGKIDKGHEAWRWHGLHLGKYVDRRGFRRKTRFISDTVEINQIIKVLQTKELVDILSSNNFFSDILNTFYEVASRR